ncbi:MAG: hypothetical protein WA116_10125 [Anaerolineaceae bacterium]
MKSPGKLILFGILAGFSLAAMTGSNFNPRYVNASDTGWPGITNNLIQPINTNSSVEDVVNLLESSPSLWKTLEITYESEFRYPESDEVFWNSISQFKLESMGRGLLNVSDNGKPTLNWVNDGTIMWTEYPITKTYRQSDLPAVFIVESESRDGQFEADSNIQSAYDTGALFIPSAFNEYIYPVSIGKELLKTQITDSVTQEIKVGEIKEICDRRALQIDRIAKDSEAENGIGRWHRYWIDINTGIFLQVEILDPSTGDWLQKTVATKFVLDPTFTSDTFVYVHKLGWELLANQ